MFNETGFLGSVIIGMTNQITGNIFITFLTILMVIIFFFIALKIPVQITMILILPLLILFLAEGTYEWTTIGGIVLLYLSLLFGSYFIR